MTVTEPDVDRTEVADAVDVGGAAVARGSLVNLVGSIVYGISGFALIVVVTRQLGTAGAGAVLEAIAVFSIVSRSAMAGTDVGLVRFISRFLSRGRADEIGHLYRVALVPALVLSTLAGLALYLLAGPLGRLLTSGSHHELLTTYLRVLAPFIPIATVYQALDGASRGFGTMVPSVAVERIGRSTLVPLLVLGATATGGATLIGLAWAGPYALALVPTALWTTVLLRRAERRLRARPAAEVPAPLPTGELARRFWAFALPRSFAGVFALTITWVDSLLLGALDGTSAVGVYSAAIRWLIVGNIAGNAVTTAFAPQIARVMAERPEAAKPLFQDASALMVLLAWPPYLAAMVFAPFLLGAFGDGFGPGAAVIVITGLGFLGASVTGPIDMLLLMAGRSRQSLINTGVALVANVGANLALIPHWGIRGAAVAWAISLTVANGLPLVQMYRSLGVHPFGPRTLRVLALCAGVATGLLAARALLGPTPVGLAVGLALGGAVLVAGVVTSPDRLGVDQVLRRTAR